MEGAHSGTAEDERDPHHLRHHHRRDLYTGIYTPTEAAGCATAFVLLAMIVARRFTLERGARLADAFRPAHGHGLTIIAGGILFAPSSCSRCHAPR
jgi:hypothetical protein